MCVEPGVTIAEVLTPKQQPYLNPTVRRAIAPQALGVLSGRNLRVKKFRDQESEESLSRRFSFTAG